MPLAARKTPIRKTKEPSKKDGKKMKSQWNNEALENAIKAINEGYNWEEVCRHYSILEASLKVYMSEKTKLKKIGLALTLTKEEGLTYYSKDMVELGHSLNPSKLKAKMGETIQVILTSFKKRYSKQPMTKMV